MSVSAAFSLISPTTDKCIPAAQQKVGTKVNGTVYVTLKYFYFYFLQAFDILTFIKIKHLAYSISHTLETEKFILKSFMH